MEDPLIEIFLYMEDPLIEIFLNMEDPLIEIFLNMEDPLIETFLYMEDPLIELLLFPLRLHTLVPRLVFPFSTWETRWSLDVRHITWSGLVDGCMLSLCRRRRTTNCMLRMCGERWESESSLLACLLLESLGMKLCYFLPPLPAEPLAFPSLAMHWRISF